ncbi:MAG: DUF1553 domain-containing protein [Verrucomicrobiota bacterium]
MSSLFKYTILLFLIALPGFVGAGESSGSDFWSFRSPVKPAVPKVSFSGEVHTPVDAFILEKLQVEGRTLKEEAERRTLIRRLYFDMLGLPPTPREVYDFLKDDAPDAYEKVVESVLDSPHYGERWGRHWLDVAGWSESSLIVGDYVRPGFWRYRDYVIDSFNEDKPFDEFVMEQLAGDELVEWRDADVFSEDMIEKLVATGFLRCAPDGTDNQLITQEDKRFDTQQTAVELATKALMGLTMNCVRCHDHKYDPITQEEYYRTVAIFQPAYDPEDWIPGNVNTFGAGPFRAIPILDRKGREAWEKRCQRVFEEQAEMLYQVDYGIENTFRDRLISENLDRFDVRRRAALKEALEREERQRSKEETRLVFAAAKELEVTVEKLQELYPEMNRELNVLKKEMKEHKEAFNNDQPELIWGLWDVTTDPSPTPFLARGDYTKKEHPVEAGYIAVLENGLEDAVDQHAVDGSTGRRLAFARWLARPDHPLTARVMANRIWQYHFGRGLVVTPDDFGERGARPSHPELLDWLATSFVESGWSVKELHRLILQSATYRQASGSEGDRSLFCGYPRRRLESEIIRDRMLAASGLLDDAMGGESVPTTLDGPGTWIIDPGHEGRYRRSVYVSSQRSTQPAMLKTFDGPVMETNWPERGASAVAPQSLILMNHPFVLECAAALGDRIASFEGDDLEKLRFAWRLVYGRIPSVEERELVLGAGGSHPVDWEVVAHSLISSNEFLYVD